MTPAASLQPALVDASAFDLSDDELTEAARKASASVHRLVGQWHAMGTPEPRIQRVLRSVAKRHSIALPDRAGLQQTLNRMCNAAWWRRALRKRFSILEHQAIIAGRVHRHAGQYVSDQTMRRFARDKRRIAELLASLVAVNQTTGEVLPLDELAAASLANPANRRRAMMVRIKGAEQHARSKGMIALFLTFTCPSRMHARHHTGQANQKYDGTGPRQAHAYLHAVWRCATRNLAHAGVAMSGLRVVEPHHDACPHWHVLVFVAPEHAEKVIATVGAYAMADTPNEPGASERRFQAVRIDPAKGSAVGYIAKYVSKSIDGMGVGVDDETGASGSDAAAGVVAWSRIHRIRQFQFFGLPAITPVRELHRLTHIDTPSHGLAAAHQAVKANDYGALLAVCEAYSLGFRVDYVTRPSSRYADELAHRIQGLTASASDLQLPATLTTRTDEWRIETRGGDAAGKPDVPPWTRFNNCAPIDLQGLFPDAPGVQDLESSKRSRGRGGKGAPRWAPLPGAGRVDCRSSTREYGEATKTRKNMAPGAPEGAAHA